MDRVPSNCAPVLAGLELRLDVLAATCAALLVMVGCGARSIARGGDDAGASDAAPDGAADAGRGCTPTGLPEPEAFVRALTDMGGMREFGLNNKTAGDMDGDCKQEVFVLGDDGKVHGFAASGDDLPGFPVDLVALSGGKGPHVTSQHTVALGDLDGDGEKEIVAGVRLAEPEESRLFVVGLDGSVHPSWPAQGLPLAPILNSSPTLWDLDHDGTKEVIIVGTHLDPRLLSHLYVLTPEGEPLSSSFPWAFEGRYSSPSTAAVGDLDGDGVEEVIFVGGDSLVHAVNPENGEEVAGWPVAVDAAYSSAAIGDIDSDGSLDVVVTEHLARGGGRLQVLTSRGEPLPGWPVTTPRRPATNSPSIADLDGDGRLEIVFESWDRVSVLTPEGMPFGSWPRSIGGDPSLSVYSNVLLADIDGDRRLDLIHWSESGRLRAWTAEGSLLTDLDLSTAYPEMMAWSLNAPAAADLKGDGDVELIVSVTFLGPVGDDPHGYFTELHVIDFDGVFDDAAWNSFHRDSLNSGLVRGD